jgi:hypothetical protein
LRRPASEFTAAIVDRSELGTKPVRMLEVQADQRVQLADAIAGIRVEPSGEPLVELGTL